MCIKAEVYEGGPEMDGLILSIPRLKKAESLLRRTRQNGQIYVK